MLPDSSSLFVKVLVPLLLTHTHTPLTDIASATKMLLVLLLPQNRLCNTGANICMYKWVVQTIQKKLGE